MKGRAEEQRQDEKTGEEDGAVRNRCFWADIGGFVDHIPRGNCDDNNDQGFYS